MKLPHKIRITSRVSYEICFVDRFEDGSTLGECRFHSRQIALLKGQSETDMVKSLIHEVLHAVGHEGKFDLPHKAIYALEHALHKVLTLNKWMPK